MTQIKLYCMERTTKDGGNKFRTFSTETSEGKSLNVRFTQDVVAPKESGYLNLDLEEEENGMIINNLGKDKNGYPCLWIKKYDSFIPDASLKYVPKSVSAANLFK